MSFVSSCKVYVQNLISDRKLQLCKSITTADVSCVGTGSPCIDPSQSSGPRQVGTTCKWYTGTRPMDRKDQRSEYIFDFLKHQTLVKQRLQVTRKIYKYHTEIWEAVN